MSDRDEIIRMAREANLLFPGVDTVDGSVEQLERFATLVRADERERIKAANAPVIANINRHLNELLAERVPELKAQRDALLGLLKEARKIIRATSSRNLVKDWDRRTTAAIKAVEENT